MMEQWNLAVQDEESTPVAMKIGEYGERLKALDIRIDRERLGNLKTRHSAMAGYVKNLIVPGEVRDIKGLEAQRDVFKAQYAPYCEWRP